MRELIERDNTLDFTLDELCDKLGLTVGAFYFHFGSKDAAIEEMAIDGLRDTYGRVAADIQTADLETAAKAVLELQVRACVETPTIFRSFYLLIPRSTAVYRAWVEARGAMAMRLIELLAERRGRPRRPTGVDRLDIHLLLSGLEGFLENHFFGDDATMRQIPTRPAELTRALWTHWRSVLLRPTAID